MYRFKIFKDIESIFYETNKRKKDSD